MAPVAAVAATTLASAADPPWPSEFHALGVVVLLLEGGRLATSVAS